MEKFSNIVENTIRLLSAVVGTGNLKEADLSEWSEIYKLLRDQDVHSMAASVIDDLDIEEEKRKVFDKDLGLSLQTFYSLMSEQEEVLSILENANTCPVVLKGAAAAVYYPFPEYRRMGDIDIIVPPDKFAAAFEALKTAGYENRKDLDAPYLRHVEFQKNGGKEIELHKCFATSDHANQNEILDELIFSGAGRRIFTEVCGYQVPMLPDLENGILLLAHLNQHVISGIGLRQIFDWYMYVENCLDDEKWVEFRKISDKIGLTKLAMTTTSMCKHFFGFKSDLTWCDPPDDELVEKFMAFVIDNGFMGFNYEGGDRKIRNWLVILRNPFRAIRYLDKAGASHLYKAGAPKGLRPFAVIYQIGYLIGQFMKKKSSLGEIVHNANESHEKTDLMKKLGITRG